MRRIGNVRSFIFVALSILCFGLSGNSSSNPESNLVWFSDHKSLRAIDTESNQLARIVDLEHKPRALAVDPSRGAVWALMDSRLVKFSSPGIKLLEIDLRRLQHGFSRPELLALNPYTGALWIAVDEELIQVADTGERLAQWRAGRKIDAFVVDFDETVWVLAQRELVHLSAAGSLLDSVDLKEQLKESERLAIDGLGGVLWIADKKGLLRLNLHRATDPPQRVTATPLAHADRGDGDDEVQRIQALEVHPVFGTVWAATKNSLLLFDRDGNHLKTIELPRALQKANAIAFDSRSLSLWIAGENGVGRFSGNAELITIVPIEKEAEHLAAGRFTLYPTVSILEPLDGSLTNNPRPRIRLSLSSNCSGTPCLLPDAYTRSLNLDVALNRQAIGASFTINGLEAFHDPAPRLPEGLNTLTARATDLFGHPSEAVTSRFTIDTIPPKFLSLLPADGSVFNTGTTVISGQVDDPTANVILADSSGSGIGMGGANFSFSVLLKGGLNTFALTARDPAGNETTVPLRVTYNPVSVKITSPTRGATLTSRGAIVTGDFQGPPNTGITVNGVIAQIVGNRFYSNLALGPGPNTLTAIATTPAGASATDAVTVTVNAADAEPISIIIEPQSGIAPLVVRFSAQSNTAQTVAQLSVDVDGNGSTDKSATNLTAPIEHTYTVPGVYEVKVTAIDSQGAAVSETVAVVVSDGRQIDANLRAIYSDMIGNLRAQNIDAALTAISGGMREKYRSVFTALRTNLPAIVDQLGTLQGNLVGEGMAEYVVLRNQAGEQRAFLIYFIRSEDGVWRIDGM